MPDTTSRRSFLARSVATALGGWTLSTGTLPAQQESAAGNRPLRLAPFRFDVTPPMGHSCCGGWIKPVAAVDDTLEAVGFVLLGAGAPLVVCSVDWTGLLNEAHVRWRETLAQAAGTSPERVAVQCVHQHNAPFACLDAERIVRAEGDLPHIVDLDFFDRCLDTAQNTVRQAVDRAQAVTHVAQGQARVDRVASNRRVNRDAQGNILTMRGSSCRNAALRALPEGLIDPWLKTVAFYNGPRKLVACHYYTTHPMSYYGDGRVSSDFAGLARKRRQAEEADCLHIYFTGCAGNVAAGKYNDGSPEMRPVLTDRVYQGIVQSEAALQPVGIDRVAWKTTEILPPPHQSLDADTLQRQISNKAGSVVSRNRPAFKLAWLRRLQRQAPIVLSSLHINEIRLLHLPSECFVQYQLRAQAMQPAGFVATAAYGDGGPWYIPVREEYAFGGYEPSVAFCDPEIDGILSRGMQSLLS